MMRGERKQGRDRRTIIAVGVRWTHLLNVSQALGIAGWSVHLVVMENAYSLPLGYSRYVDSVRVLSSDLKHEEIVDQICQLGDEVGADVFFPVGTPATWLFCDFEDRLKRFAAVALIPGREVVDLATHKNRFARFMEENAFPHPRTIDCVPGQRIPEGFHFPAVVKPAVGCGGEAIRKVDTSEALEASFAQFPSGRRMLLQTYIDGTDLGCSVLAEEGRIVCWTIQESVSKSMPFGPPKTVRFIEDDELLGWAGRIIRQLHYSGLANFDWIRDRKTNELYLLEMNPRTWLSLPASLIAGVNFPDQMCRKVLNMESLGERQKHLQTSLSGNDIISALRWYLNHRSLTSFGRYFNFLIRDPLPGIVHTIHTRRKIYCRQRSEGSA